MQPVVAFAVALILNVVILNVLQKRYEPELFRTVALAFLGSVSLRYALAIYLWLGHEDASVSQMFWGDSQTYDFLGAAVANGWSDESTFDSWKSTMEGRTNHGFIYFVACFYYVFGRNVLLVQLVNGIIGALTSIAILEIGLLIYDRKVAIRAMLFTAFFPQIIFWSSGLYKDPAVMFCIAFNMLATLQLKRSFRLPTLLLYLATAAALLFLRFYIFYVIVAATAASFFIGQRRGLAFGLATQVVLVTSVIILLFFTPVGQEALTQQRYFNFEQLQRSRLDLASTASGFQPEADVSTPLAALRTLPAGVVYLLFSPFPWAVANVRQALALPDVLVWYAMIPFLITGLASAVKHRLAQTMPILLFTTALTFAYGIFQGNAGGAYRQRTQIVMFYFLFIADGLGRKARRDLGTGKFERTAD